jgi:hypothetical protein
MNTRTSQVSDVSAITKECFDGYVAAGTHHRVASYYYIENERRSSPETRQSGKFRIVAHNGRHYRMFSADDGVPMAEMIAACEAFQGDAK